MKLSLTVLATLALALTPAATFAAAGPATLSLGGAWRCELDRSGRGLEERWFTRALSGGVQLPGTLAGQGMGDPVGLETAWIGGIIDRSFFTAPAYERYRQPANFKVPFWLQPEKHYAGAAWYQREIEIPREWTGRRVVLSLERPHWKTTVWLDDREIGSRDSLSTAHVYDLGSGLSAGRHRLTLRVDNSFLVDIGENSHSVSDHTQGNWNGVVGRIELAAGPSSWIEDVQVHPRVASRSVVVRGRIGGSPAPARVEIAVRAAGAPATVQPAADGSFTAEIALGAEAALWDEFNPQLHAVTVSLPDGDTRTVSLGLREVTARGSQLLINGRPLFLRGTLECAIFPKTGHPPTDVESWKRILRIARAHGLNHLRFHSWCPPEAAFIAGDELGFYFQVEAASWPNQSTTLGEGKPVDAWIEAESKRILRAYGNHPSFLFMAAGNEPGGKGADAWLSGWLERRQGEDDRRLFTCTSGWPELPGNEYHVTPEPRIHQWGDGLKSRINARPPETRTDYREFIARRPVPVVSHEIGQWCVYPSFDEIAKYTGYLKPRNFEIFRDSLAAHGMADQAQAFVQASGRLQALCYKEDIESALRTPGFGGFQLLDLHDFPGQGTALVGVLDPFWESKGYIDADEYRRFCDSTVPLARLERRVFTVGEKFVADIEVAHFGAAPLTATATVWKLMSSDGRLIAQGRLPARDVPVGNGISLGRVEVDLAGAPAPVQAKLVVALEGTSAVNDWDVWIYPAAAATKAAVSAGVVVARDLDAAAVAALERGDTVFLTLPRSRVRGDANGPVQLGFSSIFWNTAWTKGQAPHTLGILCDPRHPALAAFPTESHSNWQWWYPITQAGAMILDGMPSELRPIVQVIDDWVTNRRLALVFEARVGRGRLLVSSVDFAAADDPVCRQLHASLLRYAAGPEFQPAVSLTVDQVRSLIAP